MKGIKTKVNHYLFYDNDKIVIKYNSHKYNKKIRKIYNSIKLNREYLI